ncbi:MAG TPA: hypothetical protein VIQ24_24275 [Pyrinomonadaceae bacterium]
MSAQINTPTTRPTTAPPSTTTTTDTEKAERIQTLLRRSFMLADDESVPHLTWGERDQIARDIHEALTIVRELHPQEGGKGN